MAKDNKVIGYMTPADLVALMRETGNILVQETTVSDGKPAIHAALRVVNAQTGEQLPGGLPFSVVMFKSPTEPSFSNIAIGTIVPAAELDIRLPRDYFNFCNQRLRFMRVFPLDERSFVIQMDLILHNATREYVKFSLGVWGALFTQVLFELMGRGRESLVHAAEVYAATDVAQNYVSTVTASDAEAPVEETVTEPVTQATEVVNASVGQSGQAEAEISAASTEIVPVESVPVEVAPEETVPAACQEEASDFVAEGPYSTLAPEPASETPTETSSEVAPEITEPEHESLLVRNYRLMHSEPAEGKDMPEEVIVSDTVVANDAEASPEAAPALHENLLPSAAKEEERLAV
ncbi:hypothetical protein FHS83_003006 [Rhizomicrobium palustre]|uniref:Uncharacterized protein n=1 Tax=Rhizomicrobium palustre TaxID=189966 RepID=A0A846N183_9PROT|nr:hypothetical protein [Rhizomicrobium palustre]NIK89688.1 hypothetical protein [Rhizomicrobium palustre]